MDPELNPSDENQPGTGAEGTETTAGDPPKERELTDRERAMEAIVVNRSEDGIAQEPAAAAEADAQLEAQLDTPRVLTDGLDKLRVKVKVDGVESEVSLAELTTNYQKGSAADRRLQEATNLLKEARAAVATPAPPPVGIPASAPAAEDPSSSKPDTGVETRKELVAALFGGDEEKALEVLEKLGVGRSDGPTQIDPKQLLTELTPAVKQQLAEEVALEKFQKTYADVVTDPYLAQMADGILEAEIKDGKSFDEALEAAGTKTRDWLRSKGVPAPGPAPTDPRTEKLQRKAAMDNVPALNTSAASLEEPAQTASQTIAEMAKSRGLYAA